MSDKREHTGVPISSDDPFQFGNPFSIEDEPAEKMHKIKSGYPIDLNNVPGKVKVDLVKRGEISPDTFVMPSNMPGKKLATLRKRNRKALETAAGIKQGSTDEQDSEELSTEETIASEVEIGAAQRDAENGEFEEDTETGDDSIPTFKVGDFVEYKKGVYEVLGVEGEKLIIHKDARDVKVKMTSVIKS